MVVSFIEQSHCLDLSHFVSCTGRSGMWEWWVASSRRIMADTNNMADNQDGHAPPRVLEILYIHNHSPQSHIHTCRQPHFIVYPHTHPHSLREKLFYQCSTGTGTVIYTTAVTCIHFIAPQHNLFTPLSNYFDHSSVQISFHYTQLQKTNSPKIAYKNIISIKIISLQAISKISPYFKASHGFCTHTIYFRTRATSVTLVHARKLLQLRNLPHCSLPKQSANKKLFCKIFPELFKYFVEKNKHLKS